MSTLTIGQKYVELVREHQNQAVLETLYSPDIVSVEAAAMHGAPAETKGIRGVVEKGKRWINDHEVHSSKVEGPWPHGDRFIVHFTFDVTNKPSGRRFQMVEAALFTVAGEKIVREEFFYPTE